jgi:hypothetical protein
MGDYCIVAKTVDIIVDDEGLTSFFALTVKKH